jgi:hypothetical protein
MAIATLRASEMSAGFTPADAKSPNSRTSEGRNSDESNQQLPKTLLSTQTRFESDPSLNAERDQQLDKQQSQSCLTGGGMETDETDPEATNARC